MEAKRGQPSGRGSGLRNLLAASCVAALMLCSPAEAALPAPAVDQSYTTRTTDLVATAINDCCAYVAQTFTAGRDGLLAGVNVDVQLAQAPDAPLRVSLRNVEGGVPGEKVLATTVLPSANLPLSQLVTFPQTVEIRAGVKYAIVVNLEDPVPLTQGTWYGGADNPYPSGDSCLKYKPGISDGEWFCYGAGGFDVFFRTYLTPLVPKTKDQCKNGGWRSYSGFKNQGDCVSFIATGGNNGPANANRR
jgi:hypothetical protein